MAEVLQGHRVASGTWGEVWFDNEKLAEVYKFQSKATYTKEEIARCGRRKSSMPAPAAKRTD